MVQHPTRSFPLGCYKIILIAAVSLYLLLGGLLLAAYQQAQKFRDRTLLLDSLVGDLRHQTYALTAQSLLAASSGEQVFAARYQEHLELAGGDLQRLCALEPTNVEKNHLQQLEKLLPEIVEVQRRALTLAAEGERDRAWALLRGLTYERRQKTFQTILDTVGASIEDRLNSNLSFQKLYTSIAIWCIAIFTPVFILVSLLVLRMTRRSIDSDRQSQWALLETTRTLEAVLDATMDRIVLMDWDGRILSVNTAAAKGFGVSCEALVGKNFFDLLTKAMANSRREQLRRVLETCSPVRFSDARSGIVFDNIIAPLPDASGVPRGVALFARDVTDFHRARERAEAANRAKDAFLATMSHEIHTPLNGILGMAQVLEGTELNETQREYLGDIVTESNALLSLINAILELSRLEAGQTEAQHLPFTLGSIFQPLLLQYRPAAAAKGLRISTSIDDDVPQLVVGDGERLREALGLLLGNAVKFTDTGEIIMGAACVPVLPTQGERPQVVKVRFYVRDTGIGIEREDQKRIFNSFVQVDGSATRRHGGTGLGLSIASRLVAGLGGTIQVESHPDKGSEFSFTVRFDWPEEEQKYPAPPLLGVRGK